MSLQFKSIEVNGQATQVNGSLYVACELKRGSLLFSDYSQFEKTYLEYTTYLGDPIDHWYHFTIDFNQWTPALNMSWSSIGAICANGEELNVQGSPDEMLDYINSALAPGQFNYTSLPSVVVTNSKTPDVHSPYLVKPSEWKVYVKRTAKFVLFTFQLFDDISLYKDGLLKFRTRDRASLLYLNNDPACLTNTCERVFVGAFDENVAVGIYVLDYADVIDRAGNNFLEEGSDLLDKINARLPPSGKWAQLPQIIVE